MPRSRHVPITSSIWVDEGAGVAAAGMLGPDAAEDEHGELGQPVAGEDVDGPPSTISRAPLGRSPKNPEQLAIRIGAVTASISSSVSRATRRSPASTRSPTANRTSVTRASTVAVMACSIFMASTTTSTVPAVTWSPTSTCTAMTVPGSGQTGPPPRWCGSGSSKRGASSQVSPPAADHVSTTESGVDRPDLSTAAVARSTWTTWRMPSISSTCSDADRRPNRTVSLSRSSGGSDPSSPGVGHGPIRTVAVWSWMTYSTWCDSSRQEPHLAAALDSQVAPAGRREPSDGVGGP